MNTENRDIFDKIMDLNIFRFFNPFYKRHKEVLLYLFFGGLTFIINISLFFIIDNFIGLNALVNNIICWIACVVFQFFTNRTWVFNAPVKTKKDFLKQIASFFGGRLFTLGIEECILAIFITALNFNSTIVKIAAQIIVILANYIISKLVVFNQNTKDKYENDSQQ